MKKLLAVMVALLLLLPTVAYAEETTPTPETSVTPQTQETTSNAGGEVRVITIFNYQVVIEVGEEGVSVYLFKVEDGEVKEIASYDFEGVMGRAVSVVARTVPPGPEHGKVVSGYVREINREKKRQREEERIEKREQKREEKEAGLGKKKDEEEVEEGEEEREEERIEKREQKREEKNWEQKGKNNHKEQKNEEESDDLLELED